MLRRGRRQRDSGHNKPLPIGTLKSFPPRLNRVDVKGTVFRRSDPEQWCRGRSKDVLGRRDFKGR